MSLDPTEVKKGFLDLSGWDSERDSPDEYLRSLIRQQRLDLSEFLTLNEKTVLDAGCGDGRITSELITRGASPVVAVDLSVEVIRNAKKRLDTSRPQTSFVRCDMDKLPFRNAIFDCVTSIDTFVHIPDPETTVDEVSRVTRKGGMAAINMTNSNPLWRITGPGEVNLKNLFRDLFIYHGPEGLVRSVLRVLNKKQTGRHMSEREFRTIFEEKMSLTKMIKYGQHTPVYFMAIVVNSK